MKAEFPSALFEQEVPLPFEGISFVTEFGRSFRKEDVGIDFSPRKTKFLEIFKSPQDVVFILKSIRNFRREYPRSTNGVILGSPQFQIMADGRLQIHASRIHYFLYFAANHLKTVNKEVGEEYAALSAASVVFDRVYEAFYLSQRPKDSQEDPSLFDAPGGTLQAPLGKVEVDPFGVVLNRINNKLGISGAEISCIGVERIFDAHSALYNLAFLGEVDGVQPQTTASSTVPISDIERTLESPGLTKPARATLLLALGQPQFEKYGWGPLRVAEFIKRYKRD